MTWYDRTINKLFRREIERRVRQQLADETDATFSTGARGWRGAERGESRDRQDYDREELLRLSLEAWRANPLARRIVGLTTQYVVGAGLRFRAGHPAVHAFLDKWYNHSLNQLPMRVYEWCDELSRAGELFLLISTDDSGMSYVRAVPAAHIEDVVTAGNDLQQEIRYQQRAGLPGEAPQAWEAYDELRDARGEDGAFRPVMLHYAVNRPVGAVRGESDLAPLLRWLSRYAAWLEDRARLNRYRNSFLFVVRGRWASETERSARQAALSAAPPSPGSFLVVDESETWSVLNPQLESHEAGEDGLAFKKMVAAGAGLPLHFLAEPESSTRSTAESAGGPTYRHFEQRQEFFLWLMSDLARVVVRRRALVDPRMHADCPIQFTGADLSARDNAALAIAMSTVIAALTALRDRGMIDDGEFLRLAYRFGGEVADVEALLARGRRANPAKTAAEAAGKTPHKAIDPETGEARGSARIG